MPRKLSFVCEATQGGVRKHLLQLIRLCLRPEHGFEVQAILGDRKEPGFREELTALAQSSSRFQFRFVNALQRAIRPWRDLRAYMEIKEHLRRFGPNLVHTHSSKAGILGRQAAHHLGITNVLHTAHVFPFQWSQGLAGRMYLALERRAAQHTRALICVGEGQRADALARGLAPAEKFVVIHNGIEPPAAAAPGERLRLRAELGLSPSVRVIGMVARLAPQKGVGVFVRAAARMLQDRPNLVFLLAGSGPLEPEIRARLAEQKIPEEKFRLLGQRPGAETLYPVFDVLVLSSLYEGLPYVLLEAMARGVPVVATDVLGSRDVVVHNETGLLAHVSDPAEIARQTLRILDDPQLHERFSQAARHRVLQEFSFRTFAGEHLKLYRG